MFNISHIGHGSGIFLSYTFWICFFGVILLNIILREFLKKPNHFIFVILNIFLIVYFTPIDIGHLLFLLVGLSFVYMVSRQLINETRKGGTLFLLAISIILVSWAAGKIAWAMGNNPFSWLFFTGVSYLLVKMWSFLKDTRDGVVKNASFIPFINYCTYFPCFLSGPMHYYNEFVSSFENRSTLGITNVINYSFRILYGLFKVRVVAAALRPYSLSFIETSYFADVSLLELFSRSIVYSFVIYADFSGYSDVVIASSKLLGIKVPENFKLPYLAENIREFWQRWHITFTRFITQYIFVPFTRNSGKMGIKLTGISLVFIAYVITFLFVGFWHGSTVNFLLWGLYHGIGLAVYDLYKRKINLRVKLIPKEAIGRLFTFLFVSVGWVFFVLPINFFYGK